MLNLVLALQILTALVMIGLVLIQHGKGADMGASFGSGASGSLFGATGSANFLSRSTAVCAAIFFVCTLALAYTANDRPAARPAASSTARRRRAAPRPAAGRRFRARRRDAAAGAVRAPRRRRRVARAAAAAPTARLPARCRAPSSARRSAATPQVIAARLRG